MLGHIFISKLVLLILLHLILDELEFSSEFSLLEVGKFKTSPKFQKLYSLRICSNNYLDWVLLNVPFLKNNGDKTLWHWLIRIRLFLNASLQLNIQLLNIKHWNNNMIYNHKVYVAYQRLSYFIGPLTSKHIFSRLVMTLFYEKVGLPLKGSTTYDIGPHYS